MLTDFNADEAATFEWIKVAAHCGPIQRGFGRQTCNRKRAKAPQRTQDRKLSDAQTGRRQGAIIRSGDQTRCPAKACAGAGRFQEHKAGIYPLSCKMQVNVAGIVGAMPPTPSSPPPDTTSAA